jgi:hypothetical protein
VSRRLVAIVLVLAMFWQAAPFARIAMAYGAASDSVHAALHWGAEGHHHHDDGHYHQDDSDASTWHVAVDHSNVSLSIPSKPGHHAFDVTSTSVQFLGPLAGPDPVLEGLLRPPRIAA